MDHDAPQIDLAEQRALIHRGTRRANRLLALNLGVIVLLALLALTIARQRQESARQADANAQRANDAERRTREELFRARLAGAKTERLSGLAGRRQRALEAIQAAATIQQTPELLDEAVAILATFDIGGTNLWHADPRLADDPAFSPDLERVVLRQDARHFTLSRTRSREVIHQFEVPEGLLGGCYGFSPDGRWLAVYSERQEWLLWNAETFALCRRIPASMNWAYALRPQFSPDSRWLIVCEKNQKLRMIELEEAMEKTIPLEFELTKARLDRSGQYLAIVGGTELLIWSIAEERVVNRFAMGSLIGDVAWHQQGSRLGVALSSGNVVLIDWHTSTERVLLGHNRDASHLAFHPSGGLMVSTSWDGSSRFWDTGTGRLLFATYQGLAVEFDATGSRLAFVREGGGFGVWDVQVPVGYSRIDLPLREIGQVFNVAFSPDETLLGSCDEAGWYLHDLASGRLLFAEELANPRTVLFSRDRRQILVSGHAGLRRYRLEPGTNGPVVTPESIPGSIGSITGFERAAQTLDGQRIVVVGPDKGYLLEGATLQPIFKFGDGIGRLVVPVLSPDARWIAASTWKGAGLILWNAETQKLVGRLLDESSLLDFSPTGDRLVTSNRRGLQFWNPDGWKLVHEEKSEAGSVNPGPVAFHPDGSLVAVAANGHGITLLASSDGRRLAGLTSPDALNPSWLAFSKSGRHLAAATDGCELQLWDLPALKQALGGLGLVWPATGTPPASLTVVPPMTPDAAVVPGWLSGGPVMVVILLAMLLAISFAFYSLRHHRRLTGSFEKIEALAEQQQHSLLAAETELQQSRKMQALGTLAAGVAHDFNNLLSVISLSNGFLHRGVTGDPELGKETDSIAKAVAQGRKVIESMLGYSRAAQGEPQEFDLCEVVEDATGLLGQQFLSGIRLTLELDRALKLVIGHPSKAEQILINLIVNAGEAMNGRGRLLVRAHSVNPDQVRAGTRAPAEARAYLELLVQDNGPGIPGDVLPRVFEPFFTTKNVGTQRGTGLGLSTIYALAEQEGYGIDVQSVVGAGTTFRITLPLRT